MSSDDKRPRKFGDKKPFGKKPFKGDRKFGGERRFGEDRPFGRDRGPRAEGERPFKKRFGDRPDRGPRPEGDRPFKKRFGDRPDRGPRPFGPRPEGSLPRPNDEKKQFRGPRREASPFQGMYGGPKREGGEYPRGDRPFRRNPIRSRDQGKEPSRGPRVYTPEESERRHLGEDELRYLGKNACLSLFKARPDDIVRVYVRRDLTEEFADLIAFCGKNQRSYHLVDDVDLERLTDSVHHQGICIVARMKRFFGEEAFFRALGAHRTLVIYLDGVANPHNLGAVIRTAAHFGVKFICVPKDEMNKLSPALYRTAEGGAEAVNVVRVEEPEKFFDRLQHQGFHLYAFETGKKSISLFDTRLNEKSCFVFGAEVEGLSGLVKSVVETKVQVPGTGAVESLNVSVAAAVAMAEFEKQGINRTVRIVKKKS